MYYLSKQLCTEQTYYKAKNIVLSASDIPYRTRISNMHSSREPTDMPFPDSAYGGTSVLVIFCPEFTFFAIAYF